MTQRANNDNAYTFPQKVWITGSIFAAIVIAILLAKATINVLLLILAGSLIAVFFRGLSDLICKQTRWKEGICVTVSIVTTLIIVVLLFWLMGAKVQEQLSQLRETLPSTIENAKNKLSESSLGRKVVEEATSTETQQKAQSLLQKIFTSTYGIITDLYVILFIGIFFTVSPGLYKRTVVRLIPPKGKKKAEEVLTKMAQMLKNWLKGQLFAMTLIFLLTAIGLAILGMPMWLALALIAGILNFIPNFGPLIALIPAVLVALMQGVSTAAWVVGLYIVVQIIESNFITPMVQQRMISVPPALIIIAQLLIAPLTGAWGLVLATPILVIMMVLVKELYIPKQHTL